MTKTFTYLSKFPNRWSDMFIKANVTCNVKDNPAYDTVGKKIKCIKLERLPDRTQLLTYAIYE